jgi:hypothetical protein
VTSTSIRDDEDEKRARDAINSLNKEQEDRVSAVEIIVALFGAGGDGLKERRILAGKLGEKGIVAFVPEDDLSRDVAPSLGERDILANGDIDLAFVNIESWGSVAEFSEFQSDSRIAPKLRLLVPRKHHPLYGSVGSSGYLTDAYLTHDAVFGHVYMYRLETKGNGEKEDSPEWIPTTSEIVLRISERYRQWKAFRSK